MRAPILCLLALLALNAGCGTSTPQDDARRWSAVSAAGHRACGLTTDGRAWCWNATTWQPAPVDGAPPLAAVSVGGGACAAEYGAPCDETTGHACGLDRDGRAWCWGANVHGELGDGTTLDRTRPVPVAGSVRFRSVRAGAGFTCAIAADSLAWCWGRNGHGDLGTGATDTLPHAVPQAMARGAAALAASIGYACALDGEGAAFCWGDDARARLGSDATAGLEGTSVPVPVNGVHRFIELAAGSARACGLTAAGVAFCWGGDAPDAREGRAPPRSVRDPAPVGTPPLAGLSSGSAAHICALTVNGRAWCWGDDDETAPASPDGSIRALPELATLRFRSLTTGSGFTCGVTRDDRLLCWRRTNAGPPQRPGTTIEIRLPDGTRPLARGLFDRTRRIRFRDSVSAPANLK